MRRDSDRYDLVVLGGGTAGLVSSMIAARAGARVALIERERTGGDCLWTGCVPSKSLIAAAALAHRMRHGDVVGIDPVEPRVDFARVMEHVSRAIATIAPHDSPQRLRGAGVDVIEVEGCFVAPGRIVAAGRTLRWRTAIVATGSHPSVAPLHAYPTLAEGPARAADEYLATRYGGPRMRALARPVLAVLRAVEGRR